MVLVILSKILRIEIWLELLLMLIIVIFMKFRIRFMILKLFIDLFNYNYVLILSKMGCINMIVENKLVGIILSLKVWNLKKRIIFNKLEIR